MEMLMFPKDGKPFWCRAGNVSERKGEGYSGKYNHNIPRKQSEKSEKKQKKSLPSVVVVGGGGAGVAGGDTRD